MGDRLDVAVGLMGFEDPADTAFWESKGEEFKSLLRVPQFCPQNPAYRGSKISGDPIQTIHSQGTGYHNLRAFLGVDTGAPGIKTTGVFMAFMPFTAV